MSPSSISDGFVFSRIADEIAALRHEVARLVDLLDPHRPADTEGTLS